MALLNANLVSPERITNELLILNPSPTEALLLMNLLRNICKEKLGPRNYTLNMMKCAIFIAKAEYNDLSIMC